MALHPDIEKQVLISPSQDNLIERAIYRLSLRQRNEASRLLRELSFMNFYANAYPTKQGMETLVRLTIALIWGDSLPGQGLEESTSCGT